MWQRTPCDKGGMGFNSTGCWAFFIFSFFSIIFPKAGPLRIDLSIKRFLAVLLLLSMCLKCPQNNRCALHENQEILTGIFLSIWNSRLCGERREGCSWRAMSWSKSWKREEEEHIWMICSLSWEPLNRTLNLPWPLWLDLSIRLLKVAFR